MGCGGTDLGIALGVAVLRRREGQPLREAAAKSRAVSQGSQCQDVPAWEAHGYEVQGLASSLPTSSVAAAGHVTSLHLPLQSQLRARLVYVVKSQGSEKS